MALGSNAEINKLKGKSSKTIDAKGKTVIPGLFDSHSHVIRAGRFYNSELRWDGVSSLEKALRMFKGTSRTDSKRSMGTSCWWLVSESV
ncbi:amidohydrolase family protein [Sphingobacterium sp.]|uniref:amidohydrolase family protein n=1 Tax=Sphingobacterium sp. TaxID=341027 RepID=UPI0028ADA87F|nr:amidohydrolase family protein [Sphingobacterium sp.]